MVLGHQLDSFFLHADLGKQLTIVDEIERTTVLQGYSIYTAGNLQIQLLLLIDIYGL